jgi:hypothetical protein
MDYKLLFESALSIVGETPIYAGVNITYSNPAKSLYTRDALWRVRQVIVEIPLIGRALGQDILPPDSCPY